MSVFTELTPKHLMRFFGYKRYETARRMAVLIRDTYGAKVLTIKHLSLYLGLPENEVMSGIK